MNSKYGDIDQVKNDVKTLNEILSRQGASLLIDVLAESCGHVANTYKLSSAEIDTLRTKLTNELEEAISERT